MPATKKTTSQKPAEAITPNDVAPEVKGSAKRRKAAQPREFGLRSRNTPTILLNERQAPGTEHLFTKPLYVPPDIEVGWALSSRDDGGINIQDMLSRGWDFVPEDKVTDDLNEAIQEGKICFRGVVVSQLGDVENRVGLVNYGLVLMFRNRDLGQKFESTLADRFKNYFKAHVADEGFEGAELRDTKRTKLEDA